MFPPKKRMKEPCMKQSVKKRTGVIIHDSADRVEVFDDLAALQILTSSRMRSLQRIDLRPAVRNKQNARKLKQLKYLKVKKMKEILQKVYFAKALVGPLPYPFVVVANLDHSSSEFLPADMSNL
jgi:hypothetical protein